MFFCCFATGICKLIRMWETLLKDRRENATWDLKSFQPTLISKSFNAECISEDITPWTYMLRLFETFSFHFNYTNWSKKWNLYIIINWFSACIFSYCVQRHSFPTKNFSAVSWNRKHNGESRCVWMEHLISAIKKMTHVLFFTYHLE